eukprot:5044008-Pleurochrysis_carterae.AAC.1
MSRKKAFKANDSDTRFSKRNFVGDSTKLNRAREATQKPPSRWAALRVARALAALSMRSSSARSRCVCSTCAT